MVLLVRLSVRLGLKQKTSRRGKKFARSGPGRDLIRRSIRARNLPTRGRIFPELPNFGGLPG